jgi:hypothetical protein
MSVMTSVEHVQQLEVREEWLPLWCGLLFFSF